MDSNLDDTIQAASGLILQSPPGEINDVLNDVRTIVDNDEALETGILPALEKYNLAQFTVVDVPGCEQQVIVSEIGQIPVNEETRYLDPRSKTTFKFDHLRLEASDPQPFEEASESEEFRSALDTATLSYLAAHYLEGVASVFVSSSEVFVIQIVANKYNPSNYWSGRWRSHYTVNISEQKVEGKVLVSVHYYEQGNVQLSSTHDISFAIPPGASQGPSSQVASRILALIELEEGKYQTSLNDAYHEMSEKTFKGLRRALPLTRQKIDWDKVLGYKLGAELSASKGVFNGS